MPNTPVVIEQFGGLNLVEDPEEVGFSGALDMLDVDLNERGRVRTRDGYDNFTASAAASRLIATSAFYTTSGGKQILTASSDGLFLRAYNTAGATVASQALGGTGVADADFVRYGGPSAEVAYSTSWADTARTVIQNVYSWNGAAWASATGVRIGGAGGYPFSLDVQASDNRLVGLFSASNYSRVGFSGAGTPETWGANDYVDLTPGDGERGITIVSWRELVFVFKETKFFVFTGNSTGADGNPVFNYRPVSAGVGPVSKMGAVSTPNGVYFLSRRGIYRTTGGDPVLVSRAIDPIFLGDAPSEFSGGVLNHAAIQSCAMAWCNGRLYVAYPSGSATVNDRVLVFDPELNYWLLWSVPAGSLASFRTGDEEELVFAYASGSNHIGRLSGSYTTDDGTAITGSFQSGWYSLGAPGADAYTRYTRLWGSGAPTVSVFTDFVSSDSLAAAVTLGTDPVVDEGYHAVSYKGRLFSHKLSSASLFNVNRIQHDVAWVRPT